MIHIDIESRSECDLLTHGAYIYATDPSTEILCICYAFDNGKVHRWWNDQPPPDDLIRGIRAGRVCVAHNAQFERLMFDYVAQDYDIPAPKQWYCTATLCRARALPGRLGDAARALRLNYQKDRRGEELIQLMCIPPYEDSPSLRAEMLDYCERDVEVEREIWRTVRPLEAFDWEGYRISEEINDRGLRVDVELARAAVPYATAATTELQEEFTALTGIEKIGSPKLVSWLMAHGVPDYLLAANNKRGLSIDKFRQGLVLAMEDLPADTRRVVEIKGLAGKASVAKFQSMLDLADPNDERVRGAYVYFGAGQTGRFSSRGLQLHNFPRKCAEDPEATKAALMSGRVHRDVMATLSSMLRPSVIAAPGKTFVCQDWSAIEARALPWLTTEAEEVLDVFRSGRDIYVEAAKDIPGGERQIGKVAVLSLGYGGAVGAFQSMARGYDVRISDDEAQGIVNAWRNANPWATRFWRNLEAALGCAYRSPEVWFDAGRVAYIRRGDHMYCALPSGREIMYPWIDCEIGETRYGPRQVYTCIKSSLVPAQGNPWPRMTLWGGLLAENATQGTCADILVDALVACAELPVVGHTHDEILEEVDAGVAEDSLVELGEIMVSSSDWADGLPLAVEGWTGDRYRK